MAPRSRAATSSANPPRQSPEPQLSLLCVRGCIFDEGLHLLLDRYVDYDRSMLADFMGNQTSAAAPMVKGSGNFITKMCLASPPAHTHTNADRPSYLLFGTQVETLSPHPQRQFCTPYLVQVHVYV